VAVVSVAQRTLGQRYSGCLDGWEVVELMEKRESLEGVDRVFGGTLT
jgi:hypothetical protein